MDKLCPNYTSPDWIKMEETIGSDYAHDVFVTQGDVPILGVANNGKPSELYQFLKKSFPKSADKIWYSSKLLNFQNKYGNLPKDENGEYVLTKKFIEEYIVQQELELPLFYKPIKELGSARTTAFIKDLNYEFFTILFNENNKSQEESLLNLNLNLEKIYRRAYITYKTRSDASEQYKTNYAPMLKHWNELVENHKQYLNQFRIKTEKDINEDERSKDTTSTYSDSVSVNIADIIEDPIRLLIASLPDVTRIGLATELSPSDIYESAPQDFNVRSTVNYNKILTLLKNELYGTSSEDQMIERLKHLALKYPSLGILIKRLGLYSTEPKPAHLMLRAQFYRTFDNNKNNPLLGIVQENGNIIFNNMALDTVKSVIQSKWLNRARELAENGNGFFKLNDKGQYTFDFSKLGKYTPNQVDKLSAPDALEFLSKLGFVSESNNVDKLSGDNKAVRDFLHWFMQRVKDGDSLNDLFNRDVLKINNEITKLIEVAAVMEANDMDLMYQNQDGKLEYPITLNSHLSKTIIRLHNYSILKNSSDYILDDNLKHLVPFDPKTGKGNHYTVHSKLWGEEVRLELLKGLKGETQEGEEISGLKMTDYKGLVFSSILKGVIPTIRSADRKMEYAINSPIFATQLSQAETVLYMNDMKNYLKDELTVTFAFLRDGLGKELKNASKHLGNLRTFDFLFEGEDLRSMLAKFEKTNSKIELYDKEGNQQLAEKFIEQYQDSIDDQLKDRIKKSIDLYIESLLLDGVITDLGEKGEYEIKAINKEDLDKLITVNTVGNTITVTKNQFRQVAQLITYNYYVMAQEQLKLALGDLANFKNPIQVQKRTNGGTSTKNSLNTSEETLNMINKLYKSMDGALASKIAKQIVVQDIIIQNEELGDIFPKYKDNIVSSDGQSHNTLDEYRRLMLMNGTWGDKEKTYQYESQWLGLKLLADDKLQKIFPFIKEDFIRLFGEHTNGVIPKSPMYKGEVLNSLRLPQLPPLKPQGFGNKYNYREDSDSFTTNDFSKMSVSPLFPSQLLDKRLGHLLSMMKNQIGYLFFESGKKSDVDINDVGKVNEFKDLIDSKTDVTSELNYDNFSLQLDIHDYFGNNVTQSTQRTRLEFLDLFLNGEFNGKDENLIKLKKEFDDIINELVSRDRNKLLKELGLELNDKEQYRLIDDNVPKFKKRLLEAFLVRNMPYNVVDGLVGALKTKDKQFDILVSKREIESVLLSLGRNDVLKRKIHGELLVQESNAYYEEDLKFYSNKDGEVTAMEVMIPIPNEWIDYVESIGGLDVFNKKIADGKIDQRIYSFPANRIPSHGHNSLESVIVKKFLPPYVGTKIILPGEITIKSGADFDIDKLTSYLKNVRVTDSELKYKSIVPDLGLAWDNEYGSKIRLYEKLKQIFSITDLKETLNFILESQDDPTIISEAKLLKSDIKTDTDFLRFQEEIKDILENNSRNQFIKKHTNSDGSPNILAANSKDALQNRLMEISESVTLAPERFNELVKPTDAKMLSDFASEVEDRSPFKDEIKKLEDGQWSNTIELWYNMLKAESFWTAKSGLALTATNVAVHPSQQYKPIKITSPVFNLFLDGDQGGNTLGLITDVDENKISNTLAEFLTAFVDASTDDFIFKLNANPTTITSMLMLVRLGFSPKLLVKFFTQPIIMDYLKNQSINNSISYQVRSGYNSKEDSIRYTLSKHKIDPNQIDRMVYSSIEDYLKQPDNETLKNYKKLLTENKYKLLDLETLSKKELSDKEKIQVLDNFLSYQQYGRMITKLQQTTRPDAGITSNRNDLRYTIDLLNELRVSNFFESDNLNDFINGSYLKEFFVTRQTILDSVQQFFVFEDPENRDIFDRHFRWLKDLDLSKEKLSKIITDIEENFVSALLLDTLTGGKPAENLRKYYQKLFIGKNSLAKQVLVVKKILPKNALVKELTPLIQEFNTQTSRELTYDNIKLYNRKLTTDEVNLLVSAYEELIESNNKQIKTFAGDLMRFLIMQSGLSTSPINFIKIVPNKTLLKIANELPQLSEQDKISLFDTIIKNSWANPNIIPRQRGYNYLGESTRTPPQFLKVKPDSKNSLYPYLGKWTSLVSKSEKNDLQKNKLRVPKELILYKKIGFNSEENKVIYEITGKYGDGYRMTELYLRDWSATPSIIDSNNIGYQFSKIANVIKNKKTETPETNWDDIKTDSKVKSSIIESSKTNEPFYQPIKKYKIGTKVIDINGNNWLIISLEEWKKETKIPTLTVGVKARFISGQLDKFITPGSVDYIKPGTVSTLPENLEVISEEIWKNLPFSLGSEEFGPMSEKLNSIMKDYLQAIKVDYKTVDAVYKNKKVVNKAVSAVDLINKTVLAVEGKMSKRDLPEEAAHWYIELLGQDSNLFKVMMKDIINYPEYKEVLSSNDYKELYNNDDTLLRKEAIAKLIANNILMEFDKSQKNQVYRWLNALWSFLRNTFGWGNPFAKSAYNIFNSKLEDLKKTSREVSAESIKETNIIDNLLSESPDVEVLIETTEPINNRLRGSVTRNNYIIYAKKDISKTNKDGKVINIKAGESIGDIQVDLYKDNDTMEIGYSEINSKYRGIGLGIQAYKNTIAQLLEQGYILKSGSPGTVSDDAKRVWESLIKAGYAEINETLKKYKSYTTKVEDKLLYSTDNKEELKKETNDVSDANILKYFNNLFPDYSYLTAEEKSIFLSAVNKGQINIVCGL